MHFCRLKPISLHGLLGKIVYKYDNKESVSGALDLYKDYTLKITIPTVIGATSAEISVFNESYSTCILKKQAKWTEASLGYEVFEASICTEELGIGLFFYEICFKTVYGEVYSTLEYNNLVFNYSCFFKKIQISVSNFKYPLPKSVLGGIIYHVFVDRFARSGNLEKKDTALLVENWDDGIPEFPSYPGAYVKNNTFYGGTLFGVIDKLDYLQSIGVNVIFLSPIFDSPSNHKYDTSDYMNVDAMFGGNEALDALIIEAKKSNIGIILDGVFNHTGSDSIYFNKLGRYDVIGAYQSKSSVYYRWYNFYNHPDKYECWWNIDILPRINTQETHCKEFFLGQDGVIELYADKGILGFRLDVADELSDSFIAGIKKKLSLKIHAPVLYGEVWEDASNKISYGKRKSYFSGEELDGVMNYPLRSGILRYLTVGETEDLRYALTEILNNAPDRVKHLQMNILGSHDTERVLTVLGDAQLNIPNLDKRTRRLTEDKRRLAVTRLKLAYTILMTVPGVPSIFYGDEAGLEGYSDPFNRMPYPWGKEDADLLAFVRQVSAIRRRNSVYKAGEFNLYELSSDKLIYSRRDKEVLCLTIINNSNKELFISFNSNAFGLIQRRRFIKGKKYCINPFSSEIIKTSKDAYITLYEH